MSLGFLLALALVQAEPAPPEEGPAEPAPVAPTLPPGPSAPDPAPEPPVYTIGVALGAASRLAPQADDVPPRYGFSLATLLGRRYALVRDRLALGVALLFNYERYSTDVEVAVDTLDGPVTFEDVRRVSHYDFALAQTASVRLGPVRPFASVGAGVGLSHFNSRERDLRPGDDRATRLVVRGSGGLDVAVPYPDTTVGLEVGYTWTYRKPTFTTEAGRQVRVFGDRALAQVWVRHAF